MRAVKNAMQDDTGRTTRVLTLDLIKKLKLNRTQHLQEYNESVEGYLEIAKTKIVDKFQEAKKKLKDAYENALSELEKFDPSKASDTIVFCRGITFDLVAPRCYVDAYDQAIEMLEWETREEVELNSTEFRCFVMNKWDWMESFKSVSAIYNG